MAIRYHYKTTQRMATTITVCCLLLFMAYSLSLFVRHQSHIVMLSNFIGNNCNTSVDYDSASAVWIAALLGTSLCLIPALLLLYSRHFPIRMKGLAFLPSYVVLGLMTGIGPATVDAVEISIPIVPSIILLLLSSAAILYSQLYHEDKGEHAPFFNYFGINILISCLGIAFCLCLTNTDRQLHMQQPLAQTIHRRNYTLANSICPGETTTNNTITSLRVLSLSEQGRMADELFSIHGLAGSRSLLPDSTPSALIYHSDRMVYNHLQAVPINFHGDAATFLHRAMERRLLALQDSVATQADTLRALPLMHYYLCALLLDRNLPSFARELPRLSQALPCFCPGDEALPRRYSEAMAMHSKDSTYLEYLQLMRSLKDVPSQQHKECVEKYPDTYWNYYHFENN